MDHSRIVVRVSEVGRLEVIVRGNVAPYMLDLPCQTEHYTGHLHVQSQLLVPYVTIDFPQLFEVAVICQSFQEYSCQHTSILCNTMRPLSTNYSRISDCRSDIPSGYQ